MLLNPQQIAAALENVNETIGRANQDLAGFLSSNCKDRAIQARAAWYIELAYEQVLTLTEVLDLPLLRADVAHELELARKEGMRKLELTPDGDEYWKSADPVDRYVRALRSVFGIEAERTVTRDLESILRASVYAITDNKVFTAPPQDEHTLHVRIENVLRCVFSPVVTKPRLSKSVKQFEADTGIPSINTLIEYKFLASSSDATRVADELLADTERGYTSRDWKSIVYVLYETKRFRSENEWRQLLRDCDVETHNTIIVLSGEDAKAKTESRRKIVRTKQNPIQS